MNAARNRLSYRRICKILQNCSTHTHQGKFLDQKTCILEAQGFLTMLAICADILIAFDT